MALSDRGGLHVQIQSVNRLCQCAVDGAGTAALKQKTSSDRPEAVSNQSVCTDAENDRVRGRSEKRGVTAAQQDEKSVTAKRDGILATWKCG